MSERLFTEIIRQACDRHVIELREKSDGWLLELRKNDVMHRIIATDFAINDHVSVSIAKDKVAMSELLAEGGIPHIPHTLVLSRADHMPDMALVQSMLATADVVLKPLRGERGNDVRRIRSVEQAAAVIAASNQIAWAVCPYVDAESELRLVIIHGLVVLAHKKTSTVMRDGLKLFNLSLGATPEPLRLEDIPADIAAMALGAVKASGLNMAAVDVLIGPDKAARVLEVNGSFSLSYYAASGPDAHRAVTMVYDQLVQRLFR